MKYKIFKYIFFIVVIGIIVCAVYFISSNKKNNEQIQNTQPVEEKTIIDNVNIAISNMDTLNPIISTNQNVQGVSKLIFEPLINISNNFEKQMCLAEEYSKIEDNKYIIKLRKNVKWHDGENLTADDVVFTIDKIKNSNSIYLNNISQVISTIIIDSQTLRIDIGTDVDFFEYNLSFPILPSHIYNQVDFFDLNNNVKLIGTGMYKVTSSDSSQVVLEKNSQWWNLENANSRLNKIVVKLYNSTNEMYNSFKLGNIDFFSTSNFQIENYIGTLGYSKNNYVGREYDFIALNVTSNFLKYVEVRKAIAYSIDKANIITNVYSNLYNVSEFPLDYGSFLYEKGSANTEYNPERAKIVLQEAGWEYKYKYWQKKENYNTIRLSINLVVNSGNANRVKVAEILKNQIQAIGIKVNLIKASDKQYQSYLENKNYDIILTGTYTGISPNLNMYFGATNMANYVNEEAIQIQNEVDNISDNKLLKEKYKRLSQLYKDDVPYISLYTNNNAIIYSSKLIGEFMPNYFNLFYKIETWYK